MYNAMRIPQLVGNAFGIGTGRKKDEFAFFDHIRTHAPFVEQTVFSGVYTEFDRSVLRARDGPVGTIGTLSHMVEEAVYDKLFSFNIQTDFDGAHGRRGNLIHS